MPCPSGPTHTVLRREVFMNRGVHRRRFLHDRKHVRGFNRALLEIPHVDCVNAIDKASIPLVIRIEVVTEATIDKYVDHIAEGHEDLEMKLPNEQRQNVLCPDAFETVL